MLKLTKIKIKNGDEIYIQGEDYANVDEKGVTITYKRESEQEEIFYPMHIVEFISKTFGKEEA